MAALKVAIDISVDIPLKWFAIGVSTDDMELAIESQLSLLLRVPLASLNFLSMLNLSYNELVGRIPDSPNFLAFTNLSFLGNIGLCGFQVSRACNSTTLPFMKPHHSEKKSVDLVLFLFTGYSDLASDSQLRLS
jgi:hypothetical protein